ncbi:hypothetical protein Ndes2437B_g05856 [Nannochloris sp. 'desiccata']|nr:hypothetical protein KSW81_007819 [Chlorella desiccata (nom. nud.)]
MKVVALVSGGKDSCFNMVLCQRYGHEVVALANLLPTQAEVDELDSYMYQTVGHQIVAAYASCMGLPLYRRKILGTSKDQRLVYEDTAGDEVEDLAALISYIKTEIPDIGAVSSGAIASDYQRTRVERVCSRLGLVSLAYLWHQPQDPLLQRMIDTEIEAILVKIAAAGLNPRAHLGASLAQVQPHLRRIRHAYGCNICGEGGEYETMTLDCPIFTHGRIILDAWDTVHVSKDSMAPVALLHPTEFHVEAKTLETSTHHSSGGGGISSTHEALVIEVPDDYIAAPTIEIDDPNAGSVVQKPTSTSITSNIKLCHSVNGSACHSITAEILEPPSSAIPITTTLQNALQAISNALCTQNLTWHDALFIHLYVPDLSQFGAANAVYSTFLPAINPPARACVQLAGGGGNKEAIMPGGGEIPSLVVEVLLRSNNKILSGVGRGRVSEERIEKKVLHVQSISEWAPSCIGPYSQAVAHNGLVYFAGQIPLNPPTMEVATKDPAAATERSLISCQAVAIAMKTDLRQGSLWWTIYTSSKAGNIGREAVEGRFNAFLAGAEFLTGNVDSEKDKKKDTEDENEGDGQESDDDGLFIDEYLLAPSMPPRHWTPLTTFIEMPELPRNVVVEVQPVAWSSYGNPVEDSSSCSSDSDDAHCIDKVKRKKNVFNGGPHWVNQLESMQKTVNALSGHVELHILRSIGALFKGSAFIMDISAGKSLEEAAGQAAEELVKGMVGEAGGLGLENIVTAKIYLPVNCKDSTTWGAVDAIRHAVNAEFISSSSDGSPPLGTDGVAVVVPVLRVGSNAESNARLCIELFAQK